MQISMIGFGNMAKAIAQRLIRHEANTLQVSAPSLPNGLYQERIESHSNNLVVAASAEILILGVKPAQMASVVDEIKPVLPNHCLVISIAAGLSLDWFEARFPSRTSVVRAMPNIAAEIGDSATPLIANAFVSNQQKQQAERIFSSIGLVKWLSREQEMNAYTALSGSGPAYVFLFIEALIKGGISLGLAEEDAKTFAMQTMRGALNLASTKGLPISELRKAVTSPSGTTAAALGVFHAQGFEQIMQTAMQAAYDRAKTLEKNNR